MKAQEEEGAEEYCWTITQAARWSRCERLRSSVLELDFGSTSLYIRRR